VLYRRDWSEEVGKLRAAYGDTIDAIRVADPMFRDPENGDFSLRPESPAIGAGRPIDVPGLVFRGTVVNIGAAQSAAADTTALAGWTVTP